MDYIHHTFMVEVSWKLLVGQMCYHVPLPELWAHSRSPVARHCRIALANASCALGITRTGCLGDIVGILGGNIGRAMATQWKRYLYQVAIDKAKLSRMIL